MHEVNFNLKHLLLLPINNNTTGNFCYGHEQGVDLGGRSPPKV